MQPLKKRSTTIHEDVRRTLGISRDAYAFCAYVHYRCADSRQKRAGWCCDNKQELADFVGMTRRGLFKMAERLQEIGLIEASSSGDYRTTPKWIDSEVKRELSSQKSQSENGNLVPKECKLSSQKYGKNENLVPKDTYIIELENKREKKDEKNPLPPAENSTLEAKPLEGKNLPGGALIELHDPELPGVTIHDTISPAPVTDPPTRRIELGDRPTAETPGQLQKNLEAFYNCPDWQNEWTDGVCRISGVWIPDSPQKEARLKSILSDFCDHAIKNNQQRDTYRQLNAAFQQWVKRERYATWKQPKQAAQNGQQQPTTGIPYQIRKL